MAINNTSHHKSVITLHVTHHLTFEANGGNAVEWTKTADITKTDFLAVANARINYNLSYPKLKKKEPLTAFDSHQMIHYFLIRGTPQRVFSCSQMYPITQMQDPRTEQERRSSRKGLINQTVTCPTLLSYPSSPRCTETGRRLRQVKALWCCAQHEWAEGKENKLLSRAGVWNSTAFHRARFEVRSPPLDMFQKTPEAQSGTNIMQLVGPRTGT